MHIYPNNIQPGDEIRVISPSRSLRIIDGSVIKNAIHRLNEMGYKVTFSKNVYNSLEYYDCGSIEDRVNDIHEAFLDKNVKCILTAIGGYNVNQILPYIDYEIIKNNPKIICGFSDITALLNAIYAKTGLVTFYGPHFSSFGMEKGFDYTKDSFVNVLSNNDEYELIPSPTFSDDKWYINQTDRTFIENTGLKVVNYGKAIGTIFGGHLSTFNLLQATEYMPNSENIILFLEDNSLLDENYFKEFDRNLVSLMQIKEFLNVRGLVIGRVQLEGQMNDKKWKALLSNKTELKNIPIIFNADFGHTTPIFTFPIGGSCEMDISRKRVKITINKGR